MLIFTLSTLAFLAGIVFTISIKQRQLFGTPPKFSLVESKPSLEASRRMRDLEDNLEESIESAMELYATEEDRKEIYMKTSKWKGMRRSTYIAQGGKCKGCSKVLTIKKLELHHLTYARLYVELAEDVVMLDRECHQRIHDKYGYTRDRLYPVVPLDSSKKSTK